MSIAHRVRFVWLADYVAVAAGALLTQKLGAFTERWRFTGWMFVWLAIIAVASQLVRCPHCRARVPREVGKFAYIRCQACRRRFDGREGPDPEVSDELLAGGDPILLEAYREESAEMNRLSRAKTDPAAREALLPDLEAEERQCEAAHQAKVGATWLSS